MIIRLALIWFAAWLALPPQSVTAQAAPLTVRVRDTTYVRLTEWAKWQELQLRWLKRDETLLATNKTARIQFTVNSRETRFNGVQLWLLHPLATQNGEIYVSQLDINTTLRPLLTPQRNAPGRKVHTICIDPGHGGRDPGNRAGNQSEKTYTLRLAAELRDQLQAAGYRVVFTRTTDKFVELSERPALARSRGADLFVSLHFNGAANSGARGIEVFSLTPAGSASTNARGEGADSPGYPGNRNNSQNLLLAYHLQRALLLQLKAPDRGVRRARFEVLRGATMPAVLVEAGFLSHPEEGKKIQSPEYRQQMARAIVTGIENYKKLVER
jgi:N-acetylmuramoyl-L-alanine amidase